MKRFWCVLLATLFLCGCSRGDPALDKAIQLRKDLLISSKCGFETTITAEYGDDIYAFNMSCSACTDSLSFSVTEPETIAGIQGKISNTGAELIFEDTALAFPTMAGGRISPVTAPWIFYKTLVSGYLSACGETEDGFLISADDSYEDESIHLQIYTDSNMVPLAAEIFWQQQRIITLQIENFVIQ